MKQCPFLLRLCQEVLLRATRWFFFFSCLLCRKRKVNAESVSLPHKWNKRPHTAGNPGRMIVATRLDKSRRIGKQSYSLCCGLPFSRFRWCLFPFGDSFFLRIFPWSFFYPICLWFRLPPFCAFQWAASVSHFRSGRKGNSGIGRESKVKPPVFCGNLQPFG